MVPEDPYVNLPRILKTGECQGPACKFYSVQSVSTTDRYGRVLASYPLTRCKFNDQRLDTLGTCPQKIKHQELVQQKHRKKVDTTLGTQLRDFGVGL